MTKLLLCLGIGLALFSGAAHAQTASDFAIKSGDRVVFYGDSITDQRMYSLMTEQYIVTRFPGLNVRFVHSGWAAIAWRAAAAVRLTCASTVM